ncbi:hypothetical protein Bca101_041043 [Brassica carinata]
MVGGLTVAISHTDHETDDYSLVEASVSHMSELDEKQLMLYAHMANLVNLILQFPNIDLKEIVENFSKVRHYCLLCLLLMLY